MFVTSQILNYLTMQLEQLQFFPTKESFASNHFENPSDPEFFRNLSLSVFEGFELFSQDIKSYYDKTSKSNMLNNAISHAIQKNCEGSCFKFVESLSNTRRNFGILDDKYVLMFKKSPVSNIRTKQDDLIKYQELDKHVVFLTYEVDEFWSELSKVEFRYYSTPTEITYTYDITHLADATVTRITEPMEEISVGVKKDLQIKRKKSS